MTRSTKARLGLGLAAVLVAAGAAWALLSPRGGSRPGAAADVAADSGLPPEARTPAARRGEASHSAWLEIPAPVVPFRSVSGDTVSLRDYRGKIVLLNFWGTWCPPCLREIPQLVDLQRELDGTGATIVSIAVDSGSPSDVQDFARKYGLNYPIWMAGTGRVVRYYRTMGFPTTLLIDADGVIRRRYLGPQTADRLGADVRRLASESGAS